MRRAALASLALFAAAATAAPRDVLFESATEDSTAGWSRIPESLAHALIASGDAGDRERVDDAIAENELPRGDAQFFRARAVRVALAGPPMRFVRPPDKPFFLPFYGAHLFRFWFVDATGRVVFASGADAVAVLRTSHEGMHDLRVSQCHGGACDDTTEVFVHGAYRDAGCTRTAIDGGATSAPCD